MLTQYLAELVHAQLENRVPMDIPEGISIEELMNISGRNHMNYLILGGLLKTKNIPEDMLPVLRSRVMRSVMCTGNQVMEIKELEKRFEENGIKNQLMKGSRLKFIYPSPEMREMSDIDVLIGEEGMEACDKELKEMGYHLHQSIKHHDVYMKEPFMVLEAHRSMYDKTVDSGQFSYFSNFSRARLMEGKKFTYDFGPEDFYIYMMAHMAKHFYKMGCGIRNLVDIYVYHNKYSATWDEKYINEELEQCGLLPFTRHMEKLTQIWLGGEASTEFYDQLFQYMLDSGIYGKDENGIWNKFAEEKASGKKPTRFQLKLWYFFPPLHYMSEYYPWLEDHHYLLPVAWVIRAFGGVFRKKGTYKRKMINEIDSQSINVYQNIYQEMQLHFH